MIAAAFDEADRRDPQRTRQRVFLVDGNKQQLAAIGAQAEERGLKVPVLIDYIHVSGYLGKAAAALHPGDPVAAGQWADGQLLRVLHGRAKAVAATLASVAAKTRANPRTRHLDLTDTDRAVTYLTNNYKHMKYDKALEKGWPIATGMIEGACRFVIEDRFGITGARWSPDGAEVILKIRAVVVNGDYPEAVVMPMVRAGPAAGHGPRGPRDRDNFRGFRGTRVSEFRGDQRLTGFRPGVSRV